MTTSAAVREGKVSFGPVMEVEAFRFPNGLRLLVQRDNAAPVVCIQSWVRVGSRTEREGKTGICHLFEHLMFGETEKMPHGAFDRTLEEAGVETNAATFLDWTYYHQNLPKEALDLSLRLEADRLTHLVLREPQVTSEKDVVANERRQRVDDDVDGAASELLYKTAFVKHGYGIPTIGWMPDIQGFTPEDCVTFYRTYYAPNNVTLVVVGDVETEALLALVDKHYGALAPSSIPHEIDRPEPAQTEERRAELSLPTPTFKLAIGYKSPALAHPDHAVLSVLAEILFGGRGARMYRALTRRAEMATDVRGWVGTFKDPALFDIWLSAKPGVTGEALLASFDEELAKLFAAPPDEAELEKAKARLELDTIQGLENVSGRAETLGLFDTVLGDPAALFARLDAQRRATVADVMDVAKRYLKPQQRTIVMVHPDGSEDSDEEDEADEADADDASGAGQ